MTLPRVKAATVEEYYAFEDASLVKHEFYQGEIFAMAGASFAHNQIVGNTLVEIGTFLKDKRCQVFPSDLKIHVEPNSLYTYPDITIICDEPRFVDIRKDSITNPVVIIEVLSPSTADYDRGGKFTLYRELTTLQEYILLSSTEYRAEKYTRQGDGRWVFSEIRQPGDTFIIETISLSIPLHECYRNVDFSLVDTATNA